MLVYTRKFGNVIMKKCIFTLIVGVALVGVLFYFNMRGSPFGEQWDKYVKIPPYKEIIAKAEDGRSREQIWRSIVSEAEIKEYPGRQLKAAKEEAEKYYRTMAEDADYDDLNQYLQEKLSVKAEEYETQLIIPYAQQIVEENLVLCAIAEKEGVQVTDEEYESHLQNLMKGAGYSPKEFKKAYGQTIEEYAENNGIRLNLLKDKVFDQIMPQVKQE